MSTWRPRREATAPQIEHHERATGWKFDALVHVRPDAAWVRPLVWAALDPKVVTLGSLRPAWCDHAAAGAKTTFIVPSMCI